MDLGGRCGRIERRTLPKGCRWPVVLLACLALWLATIATKKPRELTEYEAKAGFLLQVTRYVTWPEEAFSTPAESIVIGIFGHDPFGRLLDQVMEGRTSQQRPLEVRRLSGLDDVGRCHLVFVSREEQRREAQLLELLSGRPVLTVGESERLLRHGGAIRLEIVDARMRFEVNLRATDQARLKLSSRLLDLAFSVLRAEEE